MPINELPASRPRLGGQALIYSVIGTDGVPQNVRVIAGDDPAWTSAFVSMIKKTEFAPATCDGQAVEVEMINAFVLARVSQFLPDRDSEKPSFATATR